MPGPHLLPFLRVEPLGAEWVELAWPLIRAARLLTTPAQWRRVGLAWAAEGRLLGVLSATGLLHGIGSWKVEEGLSGRSLRVEVFVTLELLAGAPARALLVRALERIAADQRCRTIDLMTNPRADESGWTALGYRTLARALSRPIQMIPDGFGVPS